MQGGPSGHGTQFVDIRLKVPPQYKLHILNATHIAKSTKGCPQPDEPPCNETDFFGRISGLDWIQDRNQRMQIFIGFGRGLKKRDLKIFKFNDGRIYTYTVIH